MKKFSIMTTLLFLLFCTPVVHAQNSEIELFLVSQKAFEDGFYDVAMRYINQFLQEYPQTSKRSEARLLLGQCLFFKGQYLKAFEIFQALSAEPGYQDAVLFWLGETYLKGKDYDQAKERYQKILNVYPTSDYAPQASYALAWIDFETNHFEAAKERFQNFVKRFPSHQLTEDASFRVGECAFNSGFYSEAIQKFQKYIEAFQKSTRLDQAYFYIAESYYYSQEYTNSIKYYGLGKQQSRNDATKLISEIGIGWGFLRMKQYPDAQQAFEEAQKFADERKINTGESLLGLANLFTETKEYEKALGYYTQVIQNYPKSPRLSEAYLGKANLLYTIEQYEKAIETYTELIKNFNTTSNVPDTVEKAFLGLAWTYLKSGDSAKAIATFNDVIAHTQNKIVKVSALTQIGDAYQDMGDLEKALEAYDKILRDYPDTPYTDYAQYRQGVALLKLGKTKSAILSFQSLEKNFPESKYQTDVRYYMGVAYFNQGDWLMAKDYMAKFIQEISPDNDLQPDAHYILGLSCQNLKEYDEAMKIFKKIDRVFPQEIAIIQKVKVSMAKNLYEKGTVQEALKEFKIIVYKYPKTDAALEALLWLGEYYMQTFDFKNAITYYTQVTNEYPTSPQVADVIFALGQIYYKNEEFDKALSYFKQITPENGQEIYAKAKLAIADTFARQLDPTTAIETYENIIKTSPEFSRDAYIKMASIYKEGKNYEKAITAYRNALAVKTGSVNSTIHDSELQFEIADLSEMLSNPQGAADEYLKIPYLYPDDTSWVIKAYLRTARIFEDKEDWANAKIIYEKILGYDVDERTFAQERLEQINKMSEQ